MAYPDFYSLFVLLTDASEAGLGGVLYQKQQGRMKVLAYGSHALTKAEKNCRLHSGKLEFLPLKWAICDHFRHYLYYALHFTAYTDNNPSKYVLATAKLNTTGARYVKEFADFSFDIKYRPGHLNIDAESLSSMPLNIEDYISTCTERLFNQRA